jgi:Flp pilus assembly protein TadG
MQRPRQRSSRRKGATTVETAFVLIACLLFMFGIYEYGRFLMTLNVMEQAARAGVRYAVVNQTTLTTADIQSTVDQSLGGIGNQLQGYIPSANISVWHADSSGNNIGTDWNNAKFGEGVGITISGTYQPFPSFLLTAPSFTISTTAVMNSEAN